MARNAEACHARFRVDESQGMVQLTVLVFLLVILLSAGKAFRQLSKRDIWIYSGNRTSSLKGIIAFKNH